MAKQKTKPRATGKPAGKAGRKPAPRTSDRSLVWLLVAAGAVLVVVVGIAWWASRSPSDTTGSGSHARIDHIHGLGVNPADGSLYAAAHNGVFRISDGGASRVGKGEQDTMGFTVAGDNHFLGSGHPAHGSGGPPSLGLIESTDGGVTWQSLSLAGEADFHGLRYRHDKVYGYNSMSGQLMVSDDKKTWDSRGRVVLRDFTVSPADPDTLVASGEGGVMRSTDGGRTWKTDADDAVMLFDWPAQDQLWALGLNGEVMRSADGGGTWATLGTVDGIAVAFAVHDDTLHVATQDGRIQRSTDQGKTWNVVYS